MVDNVLGKVETRLTRAQRWARARIHHQLRLITRGQLHWTDSDGSQYVFGETSSQSGQSPSGLTVKLVVKAPEFYWTALLGSDVGIGEAYMADWWDCDDLTGLVQLLLQNQQVFRTLEQRFGWVRQVGLRLMHAIQKNTKQGSQRNIQAHYDVGNEFYKLWLDPTLMYSCAIYDDQHATLERAAINKYRLIAAKLELKPTDHVLEIGTGWGGLAMYLASEVGCRVTTTTISTAQFDYAKQAISDAGLQDRITLLKQDYRDLEGRFDKLVSVEMIEAVGHQFLPTYLAACACRLKSNGLMLLQAITVPDHDYDRARKAVDFIKTHIFPGGFLPSVEAIVRQTKPLGLSLLHQDDIGLHYATTLADWRQRFDAKLDAIRAMGYGEEFIRMWRFYFCYCEGGFLEKTISDVQLLFRNTDMCS